MQSVARVSVTLILLSVVAACDIDPFGRTKKKIGSGYCLVVGDTGHEYAVMAPGSSGGTVIDEIGWRKPYIIARPEGDRRWQLFDTSKRTSRYISDEERRSDSLLRDIQPMSANDAWNRLEHMW